MGTYRFFTFLQILSCVLLISDAFKLRSLPKYNGKSIVFNTQDNLDNLENKQVVIEIVTRRQVAETKKSSSTSSSRSSRTRRGAYKENKETVLEKVVDSPVSTFLGFLFNPTTLVLGVYLSSIGWSKVLWLQKFLKIFGKGALVNKPGAPPPEELQPFQIFECEECGMELRPARGRAKAIFGRERFRCQKCGAKAESYFDIDDLNDPRAVARLERLEKEKQEEDEYRDNVDDEEDSDNDGKDDE